MSRTNDEIGGRVSGHSPYIQVQVTGADRDEAERIARIAVAERLAGSAQITALRTWYRWRGEVREADEYLLLLYTRAACFEALAARVRALHAYEVPQIVAVPLVAGTAPFLDWIAASTSPSPAPGAAAGEAGGGPSGAVPADGSDLAETGDEPR